MTKKEPIMTKELANYIAEYVKYEDSEITGEMILRAIDAYEGGAR
jgi:hypothetical protein